MQLKGQDKIIGKVVCLEPTPGVFTPGKEYELYAYNDFDVRVRGDNKRIRWYSRHYFDLTGTDIAKMESFKIDDPVDDPDLHAIEVTITLKDGTRRWCFFITPSSLSSLLARADMHTRSGKPIGILHAHHMIVLSEITEETIERALQYLDARGELEEATESLGPVTLPEDEPDFEDERPTP
jgi:hypothetical protein